MFQMSHKILPWWSAPHRVINQHTNSYSLETLEGFPMLGWYHTRHLHLFLPRTGMLLAEMEEEKRKEAAGQENKEEG